jgi:hypothetical protein
LSGASPSVETCLPSSWKPDGAFLPVFPVTLNRLSD